LVPGPERVPLTSRFFQELPIMLLAVLKERGRLPIPHRKPRNPDFLCCSSTVSLSRV
jgi:hypothetical protein